MYKSIYPGPHEGLEKATTLTREGANVYLILCNKFTKNLILKNNTQALKQSGLTSKSIYVKDYLFLLFMLIDNENNHV